MNETVNGTVNSAARAMDHNSQAIENAWRRVPESNRSSRICNPSQPFENQRKECKQGPESTFEKSRAYKTPVNGKNPGSILSQYMQDRHKRASRMLGLTLTQADPRAWGPFSTVCRARLTLCERAGLAVAALRSMPDDCALETAAAALGAIGSPAPAFLGGMDDARTWAAWASPEELKAYALAAFEAMTPKEQNAFFRRISAIEVAA